MGEDEEGTLARLKGHRRELIDSKIAAHHGRVVKTTSDGLSVEVSKRRRGGRLSPLAADALTRVLEGLGEAGVPET
jgi:class 3 adenylate cyclase